MNKCDVCGNGLKPIYQDNGVEVKIIGDYCPVCESVRESEQARIIDIIDELISKGDELEDFTKKLKKMIRRL